VTSGGMAEAPYRWLETLTNSTGKTGIAVSGWIVRDATAPTGAITAPLANQPLAGDVAITGTATDTASFKNYMLEYVLPATLFGDHSARLRGDVTAALHGDDAAVTC